MDKALVKNAASEKQVNRAKQKGESARDKELEDLRTILEMPVGRRVIWRILSQCQIFNSVWRPSAEIHYLAGRQDIGHFIMSEVSEAGNMLLFTMMQENYSGENQHETNKKRKR